jgi:histone H3/H4
MTTEHMHISSTSLLRLSHRAGIKTMTEDCYEVINEIVRHKMNQIIDISSKISDDRRKKMIMPDDIHFSLNMLGINVVKMAEPSGKVFSVRKQ